MATRRETQVVYAAGLVQGIVMVTFPAASTIFTDPSEYDLSSTQYGAMFLPQVVLAIAGSLLGSGMARRIGTKRVDVVGLAASLVSMVLLVASNLFTDNGSLAYGVLLDRDRIPRDRVRPHCACPQHLHGGLSPRCGRSVRPCAQRTPRIGHGPRTDLRGDLRRSRVLVGSSVAGVGASSPSCSSRVFRCRCVIAPRLIRSG